MRRRWPDDRVFSYWDYRAGMFHKDLGMRIDLISPAPARPRAPRPPGDRLARKGTKPSDHAPVVADLDTAPDGDVGPMVPPPSNPAKTRWQEGTLPTPRSSECRRSW